jgi:hypothetical protein
MLTGIAIGVFALLAAVNNVQAQDTQVVLTVTDPAHEGVEVGQSKLVKGVASIPSGYHVWLLVRREDFTGVWWPQAEGPVDPKTKEWKANVTFGKAEDVGWKFELAAIVVSDEEHIRLQDYRTKAMLSGDWKPIEMPPTLGAPKILKVKKTSHK